MKKREDGETLWVFREAKNSVGMKGTVILQRTSNNYQFVTPAQPGARDFKRFWTPAFAGVTFLELAFNFK